MGQHIKKTLIALIASEQNRSFNISIQLPDGSGGLNYELGIHLRVYQYFLCARCEGFDEMASCAGLSEPSLLEYAISI